VTVRAVTAPNNLSRRLVLLALYVPVVLGLTGCASGVPLTGKAVRSMASTYPTPEESRATTLEVFEATRDLIGGTTWEKDGEGYGACTLPDGNAGARFTRQDGVAATIDSVTVAQQIAELWESRGYRGVTVKPSPLAGFSVDYPPDAERVYLHVSITDYSATIHMSGRCIPGDDTELTDALIE
jgi:hypothetical protein